MKLGLSSYAFPWTVSSGNLDAPGLLAQAYALGVRVVQIADNLPLHRSSEDQLNELKSLADELGIGIEVGARGVAPEHLRVYIDIAQRLQSPILRVVMDSAEHQPSEDEAVRSIREVVPRLERSQICLAIENHDRFPARALKRIVEAIGSDCVGICFDTANSFGCFERPEEVFDALHSYIVNFHVKDVAVRRAGHSSGFVIEGRPAGQGMLDIAGLVQKVAGLKREVNAVLEHWVTKEGTIEATIEKEDKWARESVAYLATVGA
jgi:sugar phosphate isomerase/epimerase